MGFVELVKLQLQELLQKHSIVKMVSIICVKKIFVTIVRVS